MAEAIVKAAEERGVERLRAESFESVAGHGALATVDGHRLAIGNRRLLDREGVSLDGLAERADAMAGAGRTAVHVAVEGRIAGLIAIADAPRETARAAIVALKELGIRPVILTGDNRQTAERIATALGIDEVLAEVLPGAGTDVAIETADVVLMRSDPLDVATAISIGRGTVRKMRQNLSWAIGYNSLALPIAAGVFEPWGLMLRPEIAAISMSGSSVLVAVNALALKRLRLPAR